MATPVHQSMLEPSKNVLISPWKGKLIIQGCMLCDITLWSIYGTVIPVQLPHDLDFKYVIKVSSLKKRIPEAAFRKQNYLEQKVCCEDLCFNLYEVELSNRQGEKIDKLTEYIKKEQLAIIRCLEDRGFFILLTSSALVSEPDAGEEQVGLHGLHLFRSPSSARVKDLNVEDDISMKVIPVLPALNCALVEAKQSLHEEGTHPSTLVKHHFQELSKVDRSPALTASPQDGTKETAFLGKLPCGFDLVPPSEKCPLECLAQLKSYFSDPSGYILEVSTALDLLAERPQSPCVSDGICDVGFSLVMTPDPELFDSEAEVRKETEKKNNSEEKLKAKKGVVVPSSPVSNLRVQPKRKASMPPMMQSKKMNLGRPFPKRTTPRADNGSDSPTTLKLVKGLFPQKRKRGAEVLTAQFVQKTKWDRKNQEAPISKDVPVATSPKRTRKQEKPLVKTIPRAKPPVKKLPQQQRMNTVKGNQNSRIRKQPQPARGETASQLESEIISVGQEDAVSINTVEPENTTVAHKDLPGDSIVNYDSQALNMLADLALSSATSSTPAPESRNPPSSSELPQNEVLLSPKENSLRSTSDHEYHRGIKSQKGGLLPKPCSNKKGDSGSDFTPSQDEEGLASCGQAPAKAQPALIEETLEPSDASQSSSVSVEHSYALLLAEHSKKHIQQKAVLGPAFAKNGTRGPEAITPVGKVMPFRHQKTSPLQKLSEELLRRKTRWMSSRLKGFSRSHTVLSCDGSFKVTFKCENEYAFDLDSRYTNNPLEKTVVRALHGPWNTGLPENVEEVKLLLHMWVALFYSRQNKVIRSSRKVVEHSNPAKYVSINSTLESYELSEIEESPSMESQSTDPLLETSDVSRGPATDVSFPDPDCLLPFTAPPPVRGLELCVQNAQEERFTDKRRQDSPESQHFIYNCGNGVIGETTKQESSDKLKTSHRVLSGMRSPHTNGPILGEEGTLQPLDSTIVTSYVDVITQATFTETCGKTSSQPVTGQKSVYSTLENKVSVPHATMQTKTGALQDPLQHSSPSDNECQPSLDRKDDNRGCLMMNLEPVTPMPETNADVAVQTEAVNGADKPKTFNQELIKQESPATSPRHPISTLEKVPSQGLKDSPPLTVAGQKGTNCLCSSSVSRERLENEGCSLQNEMPPPVSSPPDKAAVMAALSLVRSSSYSLPSEEVRHTQDVPLQTQSLVSVSSEERREPTQGEAGSSPPSAALGRKRSLPCTASRHSISDGSLELRKNDKSGLKSENTNFESCNSVFIEPVSLSANREEVSLEVSEEDSDIDLITVSPPPSPKEEMPAGKIEPLQEALVPRSELQDVAEEIGEPEKATLAESGELTSADSVSVSPAMSEEPVENKEREGDNLQPVTLILSKESCTLEITEEINVTSDFPFDSLIEEVSPASSPDTSVPAEETQSSQAVSPCGSKLHGAPCEKSNRLSQLESGDVGTAEAELSFVGPACPVGQDHLTQVQQTRRSAEVPLPVPHRPGREGGLTLPGQINEERVPGERDKDLSFSEKVQHCSAEENRSGSTAGYKGASAPSLEKLVASGNPLQPMSVENRNLDLKHLILESSEPPFSPRKIIENESRTDTLVSASAPSGLVTASLKQQLSPRDIQINLCRGDVTAHEGGRLPAKSTSTGSVGAACAAQARGHSEVPALGSSSGSAALTHYMRPISVKPEFQTQEIPAVRMASLLKNSETKVESHEEAAGLSTTGPQSNTAFPPKGEQKATHTLPGISTYETDLWDVGAFSAYAGLHPNAAASRENLSKEEPSAAFAPEPFDTSVSGFSTDQVDREDTRPELMTKAGSETRGRDSGPGVGMNSDMHYEPLSGDSDLDLLGDCSNLKLDSEDSYTLRGSHTRRKKTAAPDGYGLMMSLHSSAREDWGCSSWVPGVDTGLLPRHCTGGVKKEDARVPCYVQIRDLHGVSRTYANFTVTKELKDTPRSVHSPRRHLSFTANRSLLNSWTGTQRVADDLTQNTLDLEYLRFVYKLKQTLKNGDCQHSTSSASVFPRESPIQVATEAFPLTKMSEAPFLHPSSRSRSPLRVTVVHSDPRQQNQPPRGHTSGSLDGSCSFRKESCGHSRDLTDPHRNQTASCHLHKLKYNSTLKECRSDISLILSEYAELGQAVMNSDQVVLQDKALSDASGEATPQAVCPPFPRQSASYEDMITDLCSSLHVKLKSVMKEACKSTFLFYLVETEDRSFFVRTKNLLRKGGHTEVEPQRFCQALHRESHTLVIIIRNEDIASRLHQIPSLLKLKRLPGVIFAGIDSPGDVLDHTYQELFCAGGFVVSDDKILEALTLVQLKEIVKILEELNGNGRWKWLLHYRENRKLRDDRRVDSTAHKKNMILKSYQGANIIELLHYHQCDSRSSTKTEILKCLINLQIQHIDARFAVFLTDKPTVSREIFENSGILVTDVNGFIENIQEVAAPFRSSYW
ncbi:protein FAM208B [Carlito syrichta]|uniref:Protein FAM208B n=1 Tax=Carlito syrichta TaxID=1868482 RepID=A0A1U7SYD9_CARSF|nr:protein FAM208B [Carlito syrichta]